MLAVAGVGLAQEPAATADSDESWLPPVPDIYAVMDELECPGVAGFCQELVPQLFYEARPDSVLNLLFYWEDVCGPSEPARRALILGAIWDGAFSEELYGQEIMDYLIWYVDPVRLEDHRADFRPGLASGDVATVADFTPQRPDFDAFTTSLADQLLPHVPPGGVEQFFCLFYAGLHQDAWNMLRDNRLSGTTLQRAFNWERERLQLERAPGTVAVTANYWRPEGNLARAGQHLGVGAFYEKRPGRMFYRITGEFLLGRSRYPYLVEQDDFSERTDRFNTLTLGFEGGVQVFQHGGLKFDVFAGYGLGGTIPFMDDEDKGEQVTETVLVHALAQVGAGMRYPVDRNKRWMVGFDLSRQWLSDRNDGGSPLDGQAWNLRIGFFKNANHDLDRRLRVLEY